MEDLKHEGSAKTPVVEFSSNGELLLKGRSIPENSIEFYKPLIEWLESYSESKGINIENYNISLRNRVLITNKNKMGDNPDTALIGTKNEVFDKIKAYKSLKIKEVVLRFISPNSEEIIETMEIIGNELIPEL